MIAPGIALSTTQKTNLSLEYGYARRFRQDDAAYAGGMRAYAGTQHVHGHHIGDVTRLAGSWSPTKPLTLALTFEHLDAGDVLEHTGFSSGSYGSIGATYRY